MTHHFGVLIPSTNTTVEAELCRLPPGYQAHFARLLSSTPGKTFSPSRDDDVEYQSKLLGTARVEMVMLMQTSASLHDDNYDDAVIARMSTAARGVPATTSARAVGQALRALGARRIGLVSPYSEAVNARAKHYFSAKHGLDIALIEGFGATDAYEIGHLGPEKARDALARINRSDIDAFMIPGANFPTMASIAAWEREFNKPVVTSTQAALWAMARELGGEPIVGYGKLLEQLPAKRPEDARLTR
jgi:maleate cis-trans isomerase